VFSKLINTIAFFSIVLLGAVALGDGGELIEPTRTIEDLGKGL